MNRKETLDAAEKNVNGQRQSDYGSPENSFKVIGEFWEVYINNKCILPNGSVKITAHDAGVLMSLFKHARIVTGAGKDDNYIDACGYLACAAEIATDKTTELHYEHDPNGIIIGSTIDFDKLTRDITDEMSKDDWRKCRG